MAWTKSVKPTTTYTKENKIYPQSFLLLQTGGYLLLQTGGRMIIGRITNIFNRIAKTIASWSIGVKP